MSAELPKVLYCSFDVLPEPTGTSARATDFIRGLATLYNADGLTAKSPDHPHIERFHGMRLMRVPVGAGELPVRAQAFERAVRRQLESDEYQLVHFTDPYGGYALCELRAQYNFKLLYEVVGFPSVEVKYTHPQLEGDRRFMSKLRRQELFCLMNADAVLVGSEQTAAMVQGLGVSRERITVIPACADVSHFLPIDQLAPPDRTPMRLLYLGGQHAWQGLSTLLFAMSIASQLSEVRLAIVGPQHPTSRLQLEEMVKYRKLTGLVDFLDPVPHEELRKVLSEADVGVAPLESSDRNTVQGAPVSKLAHYLAAGRPVIAADLPIAREVTTEACALYHAPGDENDLAEKIVSLARDPARRRVMGERAHAFARERLHADNARTALLRLYSTLLGGVAVPSDAPAVEEGSYAPTSVGAAALPEREEATQTAIDVGVSLRDPGLDPYRRLAAPLAATLEAAPVAPEPPDGPATPRGLETFSPPASDATGVACEATSAAAPPEAPVAAERAGEGAPAEPAATDPAEPDAGVPVEVAPADPGLAERAPRAEDPYEFDLAALASPRAPAPVEAPLPPAAAPAVEEEPFTPEAETLMLGGEPGSAAEDERLPPLALSPQVPPPEEPLASVEPERAPPTPEAVAPEEAERAAAPVAPLLAEPAAPEPDADLAIVVEEPAAPEALPEPAVLTPAPSPQVAGERPGCGGTSPLPDPSVPSGLGAVPWDLEPDGEQQRLEALRSLEVAAAGTAPVEVPLDEVFEIEEVPPPPPPAAPSASRRDEPPLPALGPAPAPSGPTAPGPLPLLPLGRQPSQSLPSTGGIPPVVRPVAGTPVGPSLGRPSPTPAPPQGPSGVKLPPVVAAPSAARARPAMPPPKVTPPVLSPARAGPPRLEPIARQKTGGLPLVGSAGAPPVLYPSARPPAVVPPAQRAPAGLGPPPGAGLAGPPVEIDAGEVEVLPEESSGAPMTPASGLSPSDEWLGHVLLGYAPFSVAVPGRTATGETPVLDLASWSPEGPANPRR